ncbi:hypothetical protein Esti_001386 [Eimeria stiedai]
MQQELTRMQRQQGQQQARSFVPPLARLAALLASTGARSDGVPASAVLGAQQQKQLQHELQQLLMRQLAAAQREGRAVAAAKDAASEAVDREETLAELHRGSHTNDCVLACHLSLSACCLCLRGSFTFVVVSFCLAYQPSSAYQLRLSLFLSEMSPLVPLSVSCLHLWISLDFQLSLKDAFCRLRDTASSSLLSRLAALLLSKEQQPLQRPQAILQVLLHLSSAAEQQRNQARRQAAATTAVQPSSRRPPAHAAAAATVATAAAAAAAEQEAATGALSDRAGVTSAAFRGGEARAGAEAVLDNLALSLSHSGPPAVRRLHPPAAQPAHALPGLPYDLWGLDELSLLRDLLFALQGIEGRFVRYDPRLQTFCLSPTVHASPSVQGLVARVGSLGALYLRVQAAVESHSASLLETRSLTAEAFYQSVREQLRQYFKLLAVLEQDLLRSEEAATQETAGASSGSGGTATLRRLAVWLQEPYQRMRLLACLTEATKGLQGGALLSTIHAHCALGEAELRTVALDILQQSLQPLADSIEAWTRYGELRDDAGEFFVREAPQDLQLSSWCSRFVLVPHQIPSFMPPQLPERLLLAGKSVLYSQLLEKPFRPEESQPSHRKAQRRELPLTLQELLTTEEQQLLLQSPQQQQQPLVMPHTQQQLDERGTWLQHGQQQAFNPQQQHEQQKTLRLSHDPELPLLQNIEERVSAAAATGNQRLVALLLWDHQLLTHLEAIRRFVLLGDGDFTSMLLDAAMQQPQQQQQHAGSMSLQPLILSAIDTAARQCSSGATLFAACPALAFALTARFPHTSYLQQQHQQAQPGRSTNRSSSSSTCSSLWRGLVLHLRIDGPLRFFIGEGLIKCCHKLFAALWKAHLTHGQLQAACLRGNSLQKQLRQQQRAAAAAAAAAERKAAAAAAGRNLVSRATAAAREELLILHVSQTCHLLNEMLHFSWQWLHFAHQEVLSPNWRLFYKSIPRCRDLDEFISLLWRCLEQQHDGLFLYDTQEAVAAASERSNSSSVQLHALLEQMQDTCSSMASRAEFRFAAAAEQQLLVPPEERAAAAQATSSSSSSMLAVEEQRQAFRRQMLQLLQLLESKQSEVRAAAAAAQAISGSGSSSRSRMHLDHCMAIRSLRTRLDYNDFYEHQRQMLAVTTAPSGDTSTSRFPSLLLQQQHAVAASSSSSRSNSRFDKRADGFAATGHHGSNGSSDDTSTTGAGGPVFLSKLHQQLQQQLHQQMADEATRPPTACEASAPPSPLLPQGLRNTATATSANRLLGRI